MKLSSAYGLLFVSCMPMMVSSEYICFFKGYEAIISIWITVCKLYADDGFIGINTNLTGMIIDQSNQIATNASPEKPYSIPAPRL